MQSKKKNILSLFRVLLAIIALCLSCALIVVSIYVDSQYFKLHYYVHTCFLVLLIAEFLFIFTYVFWILFQHHYSHFYKRSANSERDSPSDNTNSEKNHSFVSFYASTHSRQLVSSFFSLIFCIVSIGTGIAIINLSVANAYEQISQNESSDYFSQSRKLLLAFIPLMVSCQFVKGALIAADITKALLLYIQLSTVTTNSSSGYNSNDNNSRNMKSNAFPNNSDDDFIGPRYSNTFIDTLNPSNGMPRVSDTEMGNFRYNQETKGGLHSSISIINDDKKNIRKTLVKSCSTKNRLTLHSANMTPPLSIHSFSGSAVNDGPATGAHSPVSMSFSSHLDNDTGSLSEKRSSTHSNAAIATAMTAPRSRSALSLRLNKKQLSPIHEPKKAILVESPVFKKRAIGRAALMSDDDSSENVRKLEKKEKYKELNNLLLDNFHKDFNDMLRSSVSSNAQSKDISLNKEADKSANTSNSTNRRSDNGRSSTNNESIEKYKRALSRNQKNLRISVAGSRSPSFISPKSDKHSSTIVPSSPPPQLPEETEQDSSGDIFTQNRTSNLSEYSNKLKPLYLAKQLARNSENLESVNTEYLSKDIEQEGYSLESGQIIKKLSFEENPKKLDKTTGELENVEEHHYDVLLESTSLQSDESKILTKLQLPHHNKEEHHKMADISPESYCSTYDPLYENDLQEIPSIPTNTLWPFSRSSVSPNSSSKFSPSRTSSTSIPPRHSSATSPTLTRFSKIKKRQNGTAGPTSTQRKRLRHISLEEWSSNSKEWMTKMPNKGTSENIGQVTPNDVEDDQLSTSSHSGTLPEDVLDEYHWKGSKALEPEIVPCVAESSPIEDIAPRAIKQHVPEDSFTFENTDESNNNNSFISVVPPLRLSMKPESPQELTKNFNSFKFPITENQDPKKLIFYDFDQGNVHDGPAPLNFEDDENDRENDKRGRDLPQRKYLSRSWSPVKKSCPLAASQDMPLLSYSKAEINVLNNIRGEKRRSLLKHNQSESSSPVKKKRSRSPLKRISATFHEQKRSTVIFNDDFNFDLDKELMKDTDSNNNSGSLNNNTKTPTSLNFSDPANEFNQRGNVTSSGFANMDPRKRKLKSFSINSLKSMMSHLHNRSMSATGEFLQQLNEPEIYGALPVDHTRHKSLDYKLSFPNLFQKKNATKEQQLTSLETEPMGEQAQTWNWNFTTQDAMPNNDDSLIKDIIQNADDYDYNFALSSRKSNTPGDYESTLAGKNTCATSFVQSGGKKGSIKPREVYGFSPNLAAPALTKTQLFSFAQEPSFLMNDKREKLLDSAEQDEDSYVVSDRSTTSAAPSGYIGEYDKEKWKTLKRIGQNVATVE